MFEWLRQDIAWDRSGEGCKFLFTAISRKFVGKHVYATAPKGNMGYDQYTVPDDCSCRTYFCCFPLALANTFPWPFVPILSNFFEKKENLKPPTMPFRIVACTFPDNLSRNSCICTIITYKLIHIFYFRLSWKCNKGFKSSNPLRIYWR